MAQYIDKSALVAEIEKRINENKKEIQRATRKHLEEYFEGYEDALVLFKEEFIDTLEVKGVDLNEEIESYFKGFGKFPSVGIDDLKDISKYFFELGVNASNPLTWRDMAEIDKIAGLLETEWLNGTPWDGIRDWGFYQEVLKRFKAQKGE